MKYLKRLWFMIILIPIMCVFYFVLCADVAKGENDREHWLRPIKDLLNEF